MKKRPGIKFLLTVMISITTAAIFYFISRTDTYLYHYGNKAAIIDRFKLAERRHEIFSGEQIVAMTEAMRNNRSLTEWNKIELARELVYQQIINNQENMDITDTNKILFASATPHEAVSNIINAMNQQKKGIKCAGTATILALLYRMMGHHAWLYAYGSTNPDSHLTHTLTLVELDGKIYLEDGYFNYFYVDEDYHLIPFEEVLKRNKLLKTVYLKNGELNYRRNIIFPGGFFSQHCPEIRSDSSKLAWTTFKANVFSCIIKKRHHEAEEYEILGKDYHEINPDYLANYPIWLTDMETLVYYPLSAFKQNKVFVSLVSAGNRSHFVNQ